jgi:hypothetical protein
MPEYRIYCINGENRVVSRHDFDVRDDLTAFEKAMELCGTYEVEIWEGARLVTRLAKDGTASHQRVSGPRTSA